MTNPIIIFALHCRWNSLRRFHTAGSVLVDYRTLKNYAYSMMKRANK